MAATVFYPDGSRTTSAIPTAPDVLYVRTREDLLAFEDARENGLLQAVANYYLVLNDQNLWGDFIRAYAQEFARLEYDYAYDIVGKNPIYLTPPDIKRRWAAPLYVNRLYPTLDPVQYDLAYKLMLVQLLQAYRQGATVAALQGIITAYTGLTVEVLELYRFIGQGFYDQSDRNSISASINVGGGNPLDDVTQLIQLEAITNALYGALDLGKPAHVGLEFKLVFGLDEYLDTFVTGIQDLLRIFVVIVEGPPFNPMLYQAPDLLAATPRTGIAPSQAVAWKPNTPYVAGQLVIAGVPGAVYFQVVTTPGTSAAGPAPPSFNPTPGGTTSDGPHLVWTNAGSAQGVVLFPVTTTWNQPPPPWLANHAYSLTEQVLDPAGNVEAVTVAGTSGASIPPFNPTVGGTTPGDGGVTWTNLGPQYPLFATILDPNGFVQMVSVSGDSYASWVQDTMYSLDQIILDANGNIQEVTTPGVSGASSYPHNLYYPPFSTITGGLTQDGTVIWTNRGPFVWSQTLGGITQDSTTVWVNIGRPPGLVMPRLDLAWEVKGDNLSVFETS